MENRKAIKIARENHRCGSCGKLIAKGDSFAMRMDRTKGRLSRYPTCLDCYMAWLNKNSREDAK